MHQIEIDVVHLEFFQRGVKSRLDVLWSVLVVPKLSCKKDL